FRLRWGRRWMRWRGRSTSTPRCMPGWSVPHDPVGRGWVMNYYYKATRLDGTDFWTGTVKYAVGERTTHPTSKRRTKDDPSTYLSVSTVISDCTGFRWPCRLFRVEGVGRAMTASDLPNKRAF